MNALEALILRANEMDMQEQSIVFGDVFMPAAAARYYEQITAKLAKYETPMPCGHAGRYAVNGDEGTGYCALCELAARDSLV